MEQGSSFKIAKIRSALGSDLTESIKDKIFPVPSFKFHALFRKSWLWSRNLSCLLYIQLKKTTEAVDQAKCQREEQPYLVMSKSSFTTRLHQVSTNFQEGIFLIERSALNRHVAQVKPTSPLSDRVTMHATFPFLGLHQHTYTLSQGEKTILCNSTNIERQQHFQG